LPYSLRFSVWRIKSGMDFSSFAAISFDCYGTLIDWESGILPVLRTLLSSHGHRLPDAVILELYAEFETRAEAGPYKSYRDVLRSVVKEFAERYDFEASNTEVESLHQSVSQWLPFPDTVAALRGLQEKFKLAIISNIDDDLFSETRKHLGIDFADVITAKQAQSYKPSINNFQIALRRLGIAPQQLLHAGQSVYHDVVPARSLGITTAWVNRKSARPGVGAVPASTAKPAEKRADMEVPDLATLAAKLLVPLAG
jgi:2-haloacid dehalogenase